MLEALESGVGLEVVLWLQGQRAPLLDALTLVFYVVGGFITYLLLFVAAYWAVDKRLAKQILLALILSGVGISAAKLAFERPRPFVAHPNLVDALTPETTYGLPSGHVGISLAVWGVVAAAVVWRWRWLALALFIALVAWSRMYAGVHYPQDVILGAAIGGLTAWFVVRFGDSLGNVWSRARVSLRLLLLGAASLLLVLLLWRDRLDVVLAGVILGSGGGFLVEAHFLCFSPRGPLRLRVWRVVFGLLPVAALVGVIALFDLTIPLQVVVYTLIGLVAAAAWPYLCLRLGWMARETQTHLV